MPRISGYVKKGFKVRDKNEDKNNMLMSFRIDHEKLLEKHKAIWTKIEDLTNIELIALLAYDDRYIKTKIITYGNKLFANFGGLHVPKDDIKSKSFTVIATESLLVYQSKYYLQVHFDRCAYKIVNKQMIDYLDENLMNVVS